jgi:glycosyltransferase involved in cell wall biosynthesis
MIDIFDVRKYDIVFLQRDLIIHVYPLLEKMMASLNPRLIFDFDDAIYLIPPGSSESPWRKWLLDTKKIERIIKLARYTICGNNVLKKYAIQYSGNVTVIPTSLAPDEYEIKRDYSQREKEIVIGWIGSPFTTGYLKIVAGALKKISQRYNVIFRIVGGKEVIMPGVKIEEVPWKGGREAAEINNFDIGIMPLTDDEWSRGKCGFKLLQYMACGVPAIASPVGVNQEIIENGKSGFLASTEDEWVDKLSALIEDKELRKKFGQAGRKTLENRYSTEVNAPLLKAVLEKVYNLIV